MRASIIIPVYKAEDYISDCLNSVLAQSTGDFEVICVDDGSPDNSSQVIESFADNDSRVRLIRQENGGASSARNAGYDASSAKYVTFVDADDEVSPHFLSTLISAIEKYQADIAMGNKATRRGDKETISANPMKDRVVQGAEIDKNGVASRIAPHGKLYHRSFLEEHSIRFFEGITYEDYIYWTECLTKNPKVATVNDVVYTYKRNPDSISSPANRLKPFNVQSRIVQSAECLRIIRESGLKKYERRYIRSQFDMKIMSHVKGLAWGHRPVVERQEAYKLFREGLAPHKKLISNHVHGWRRLVYKLILDGTFDETVSVLRFVEGKQALPLRIRRSDEGSKLYVEKSELPSLEKAPRKYRDVSDAVKITS